MLQLPDEEFAARLIQKVARSLEWKRGIISADLPDLQQDLWVDLLERLPSYRPDRGHIRAFIRRVVNNKAATILKARAAAKRGDGRPCLSLNWEFEDDDGEVTELHESISVDDYLLRTRGTLRSELDRLDLALDIRKVLDMLPPHQRVVCLLLIDRDVSDVANVMGMPRSTLRDLIKRLRRIGESVGLRKYFE